MVEGKRRLDTFASTNPDFILRSKGIGTIALGGFLTNCCVESTMRSAYERGYDVVTLTDCVTATPQKKHDNAIAYDYPMFSRPMSSKGFLDELGAPARRTRAGVPRGWCSRLPESCTTATTIDPTWRMQAGHRSRA